LEQDSDDEMAHRFGNDNDDDSRLIDEGPQPAEKQPATPKAN
jgi:hypothetical protein